MTFLPEPPSSKGMKMIAAYRAARLSQRPVLRTTLRQTHAALRQSREQGLRSAEVFQPQPVSLPVHDERHEHTEPLSDVGSVFAGLMTAATAEVIQITAKEVLNQPDTRETMPANVPDSPPEPASSDDDPSCNPVRIELPLYDPPLAEIGFGPGMLIRLSQLGLHTTRDLAAADVSALRAGLGDISRLVNVETWINNARHHMKDCRTDSSDQSVSGNPRE